MKSSQLFVEYNDINNSANNTILEIVENFFLFNKWFRKECSGIYSALYLGNKIIKKISQYIEICLYKLNYQQNNFSSLVHIKHFENRTDSHMFAIEKNSLLLSPTYEPQIFEEYKEAIKNSEYVRIFQISKKFRNDSCESLFRTKEFIMLDLYCLANKKNILLERQKIEKFFSNFVNYFAIDVQSEIKHEDFFNSFWSKEYNFCFISKKNLKLVKKEKKIFELAHLFLFELENFFALSFGIGITRFISIMMLKYMYVSSVDNCVRFLIKHPMLKAFLLTIVPSNDKVNTMITCEFLYSLLRKRCIDVLFDDRKVGFGRKMKDLERMGIDKCLIVNGKRIVLQVRNIENDILVKKEKVLKFEDIEKIL